jgi:hypothetical protein
LIYSRRQLLGAGAAASLLATAANGQTLAEIVAGLKDPTPQPKLPPVARAIVPAQPRVMVDGAVDPRLLARARMAFERHRHALSSTNVIGIADFSRPSREARFHVLDTMSGRVSSHLVAHGRGSDPDHSGYLEYFSNRIGSEASSHGGYITADLYNGKYGRSMKLRGLDPTNNNAEARAIVVHHAWYAEADQLDTYGKLGRSEGCFAVGYNSLQQILARLGPGRFLFADKLA